MTAPELQALSAFEGRMKSIEILLWNFLPKSPGHPNHKMTGDGSKSLLDLTLSVWQCFHGPDQTAPDAFPSIDRPEAQEAIRPIVVWFGEILPEPEPACFCCRSALQPSMCVSEAV